MVKLYQWRVQREPTGQFRAVNKRGWPEAYLRSTEEIVAYITCDDAFSVEIMRSGKHAPLSLRVADRSVTPWQWRRAKGQFKTMAEAKAKLEEILTKSQDLLGKDNPNKDKV